MYIFYKTKNQQLYKIQIKNYTQKINNIKNNKINNIYNIIIFGNKIINNLNINKIFIYKILFINKE